MKRIWCFVGLAACLLGVAPTASAQTQAKKPNIVVNWGDDIGYRNVSAYNQGMMGYETPNIDRIAKEGALFTDWYGQQSCTAGPKEFPPRQKAGSVNHDAVMESLQQGTAGRTRGTRVRPAVSLRGIAWRRS